MQTSVIAIDRLINIFYLRIQSPYKKVVKYHKRTSTIYGGKILCCIEINFK